MKARTNTGTKIETSNFETFSCNAYLLGIYNEALNFKNLIKHVDVSKIAVDNSEIIFYECTVKFTVSGFIRRIVPNQYS